MSARISREYDSLPSIQEDVYFMQRKVDNVIDLVNDSDSVCILTPANRR